MKPVFRPKRILWLDLEMSGLDPMQDEILEVGVIVTDWNFTKLAAYQGVVRHQSEKLKMLLDRNAAFWDKHLKTRRDLETQNVTGKPLGEVEQELVAFCREWFADESKILLAGNSIHQDRKFIDHWWPIFAEHLHYRMLDVSAWKVVMEGKFGKIFRKPEEHRALGDIEGSIAELKHYVDTW